ncbi:MAG: Hpt domain-containing protein [Deltaproteobacteria bacterium]|nr:Hpt domain-containing protein [Deltaproteobacteria bacterium]
MLPNMDFKRLCFWGPRVKRILSDHAQRISGSVWPRADVMERTLTACERFMEISYQAGALQSCMAASQMFSLMDGMKKGEKDCHQCQQELKTLLADLDRFWGQEKDVFGPVRDQEPTKSPYDGTFRYLGTEVPFDAELTQMFLADVPEQLVTAEQAVLSLESNPADQPVLNALFRAIHTMKGNAGFLGLTEFKRIAHAVESLLDRVRRRELRMGKEHTQMILESLDTMGKMKDNLQRRVLQITGQEAPGSSESLNYEEMAGRLEQMTAAG